MIVISPLSADGFVSSQVYDHGSTIQFMERVFGVEELNIRLRSNFRQWNQAHAGAVRGRRPRLAGWRSLGCCR
jgi:phospholipase C